MNVITKGVKFSDKPNQKEIIRDKIFTRFDIILGLEWHNFNIVLMTIAHAFGGYMIYRLLTFQSPWSVILFFGEFVTNLVPFSFNILILCSYVIFWYIQKFHMDTLEGWVSRWALIGTGAIKLLRLNFLCKLC